MSCEFNTRARTLFFSTPALALGDLQGTYAETKCTCVACFEAQDVLEGKCCRLFAADELQHAQEYCATSVKETRAFPSNEKSCHGGSAVYKSARGSVESSRSMMSWDTLVVSVSKLCLSMECVALFFFGGKG